jgi:signal transduction histidine kinase
MQRNTARYVVRSRLRRRRVRRFGGGVAHGFAKQSRGKVEIRSAVGSGTTITLYLPALCKQGD